MTNPRDFYALNITEDQINKMIKLTEAEMAGQMADLAIKEPPFLEAEQLYLSYKRDFDLIKNALDDNKLLLESLSRFKTNTKSNKEIRVMRTTSHVDAKPAKKTRNVKWIKLAVNLLIAEDKYLSGDDIVAMLHKIGAPDMTDMQRYALKRNMLRAAEIVMAGKRKKKSHIDSLVMYKNRFGLLSWCHDDFTPDAHHIREFMYDKVKKVI